MDTVSHLREEFKTRVFEESYPRIEKCLTLLDQEQLWDAPNTSTVSAGCLTLHLMGNARQWILHGIGGKEDVRNRDNEFVPHPELSREDLLNSMWKLKKELLSILETLSEEDLVAKRTIQRFEVTGFSVLVHVIEHFSYHTGQISLLTKLYKNQELGYYDNHDL